MKNHGVMVLGASIAEAWDDLYYLERAAQVQLLAMSSGRPLLPIPDEIAQRVATQIAAGQSESARLHLESVKRVLEREDPAFLS
jgi:ribulose-5-phosphate 4-epimerase/fuculose-1-phosphate aldolase